MGDSDENQRCSDSISESLPKCVNMELNSDAGRFLVARKEFLPGEIIFVEPAMMEAPVMESLDSPTCMGCCKIIDYGIQNGSCDSKCSVCGWPVCNNNGMCQNVSFFR